MTKPRVAFIEFTSCEGCQLSVLDLEDEMLDILGAIEIVNFREAMTEKSDDYDIAFVEGSITRESDIPKLKKIRETASYLVAMGACATIGGINAVKNGRKLSETRRLVYGDQADLFETCDTRAIDTIVPVDAYLHGCPINKYEFLELVKALLMGTTPKQYSSPVCMECKIKENDCICDSGQLCMGPVSRGGCDAICPTYGNSCEACRGILPDANIAGMIRALKALGADDEEIQRRFTIYTSSDTLVEEVGGTRD